MPATVQADFAFEPKVWQDHIRAYFDKKLVYGSIAVRDDSLSQDAGKGMTVNFPYFKAIGDAEEPAETAGLVVDNMEDDSFYATVKEVGKAVGIKKKAFKKSAARTGVIIDEVHRQLGRVMAEKVDADLLTEFSTSGNWTQGYLATDNLHIMTVRILAEAKIVAFGDKADDSIICFLHPLQFLDVLKDSTSGFLQANANDPMFGLEGFKGRLLGMAIVTVNSVPKESDIDSTDAYSAYIHKPAPYGVIQKQDLEIESDYDLLQREWVIAANEWYAVKSFHGKVAALDKRTAKVTTCLGTADGV